MTLQYKRKPFKLDSLIHFFVNCSVARSVWKEAENYVIRFSGKRIILDEKRVIFGILKEDYVCSEAKKTLHIINKIILIGKHTISKFKFLKSGNPIILFENELWMDSKPFLSECLTNDDHILSKSFMVYLIWLIALLEFGGNA